MLAALQLASILIYLVLRAAATVAFLFFSFTSFFFCLSCVSCHAFQFPPKCIKKYCCCMVGYEQRVSFLIKFMVIVSTVNLSKFFMLRTKLCPALGSQPVSPHSPHSQPVSQALLFMIPEMLGDGAQGVPTAARLWIADAEPSL